MNKKVFFNIGNVVAVLGVIGMIISTFYLKFDFGISAAFLLSSLLFAGLYYGVGAILGEIDLLKKGNGQGKQEKK